MSSIQLPKRHPFWLVLCAALPLLSACVGLNPQADTQHLNQQYPQFTQGLWAGANSAMAPAELDEALSSELSQAAAVAVALRHSPVMKALIAEQTARTATLVQQGRLPNPVLSLERLVTGPEVDIGRLLTIGLVDVLTLPWRQAAAGRALEWGQAMQAQILVDHVTAVRMAWVDAVAAQARAQYAQQVFESASASSELAHRMQQAGNFTALDRMRQQGFQADAVAMVAQTNLSVRQARETLVRLLGLSAEHAERLRLPGRLPDIPAAPSSVKDTMEQARDRIDLQVALAWLNHESARRGVVIPASWLDVELGVRRDSARDTSTGQGSRGRGGELDLTLPLFDDGSVIRQRLDASLQAAAARVQTVLVQASSHVRQAHDTYRTAHELARHYQTELIPLRRKMAEENLLRYNAMMISVFELLADNREQIAVVSRALDAQAQFWRADAALQASVVGRPIGAQSPMPQSTAVQSYAAVDRH